MIGITSYGGYIPRLRLNRMSIFQSMGWFAHCHHHGRAVRAVVL